MKFCTGGDKMSSRTLNIQNEVRESLWGGSKWLLGNKRGENEGRWEALKTSCFYLAVCLNPIPTDSGNQCSVIGSKVLGLYAFCERFPP